MVWFRLGLGLAQMAGATAALAFLVFSGPQPYFWWTFGLATASTLTSRWLFWKGKGWSPFFDKSVKEKKK